MQPKTWGAIFDWDGVIIDSSSHHDRAWTRLAEEEKRVLPPGHFKEGFGRRNQFIIPNILKWSDDPVEIERIANRKETLYREIMSEGALEPLPGVRQWLEQLSEAGIPCAVGSSTPRANIDLALSKIGLAKFFQAIVTAEDVKIGKPNPEVFLTAASRIHQEPARCVVFEDAHVGIEAARAGGMRVVGVATTHPLKELGSADIAVQRLDELTVAQLGAWFV